MPKLKTHKGTAKRIKITGSGKLVRERAQRRFHVFFVALFILLVKRLIVIEPDVAEKVQRLLRKACKHAIPPCRWILYHAAAQK